MLSATDLSMMSTKTSTLPVSGAPKSYAPKDNNPEEKKLLQDALQQYEELLKEERVCRKLNLSIAEWNNDIQVAVVTTIKGIHFQKFGYSTKEGTFLLPEETLFLIDQGVLELNLGGLPVSLCEAYMLLLPLLPSVEYYEVYAYVCRLGFMVTRYCKSESETLSKSTEQDSSLPVSPTNPSVHENLLNESFEPMASGHMQSLWCEKEKPCMKPEDATSTAAVLSKLQVIDATKFENINSEEKTKYQIDFNVYASKDVKKSNLGPPNFRIIVCKYTEQPPSLFDIACLTTESNGVNLKFALVNQGTVSFYEIFEVDMPTHLSPLG